MGFLFPTAKERFLSARLDWLTADIRLVLLQIGTTLDPATQFFLSDIPAEVRVGTSTGPLSGRAAANGAATSFGALFEEFVDQFQRQIGAAVLVEQGIDAATTLLVASVDAASGFPFVGLGRNYYVAPQDGAWFRL